MRRQRTRAEQARHFTKQYNAGKIMGYLFCPEYQHMKASAVCMAKCHKYQNGACSSIARIFRGAGYSYL